MFGWPTNTFVYLSVKSTLVIGSCYTYLYMKIFLWIINPEKTFVFPLKYSSEYSNNIEENRIIIFSI